MGKTEIGHKRKYSLRPFFLKKKIVKIKKKKRFKKPSSEQNDESLKSKN